MGAAWRRDDAEAVRFFRKAADAGDANAMAYLGIMYAEGHGVAKDEAEAVRLYRLAMETDRDVGVSNLAWMYAHGIWPREGRTGSRTALSQGR